MVSFKKVGLLRSECNNRTQVVMLSNKYNDKDKLMISPFNIYNIFVI